jgi:hypothetical protein
MNTTYLRITDNLEYIKHTISPTIISNSTNASITCYNINCYILVSVLCAFPCFLLCIIYGFLRFCSIN